LFLLFKFFNVELKLVFDLRKFVFFCLNLIISAAEFGIFYFLLELLSRFLSLITTLRTHLLTTVTRRMGRILGTGSAPADVVFTQFNNEADSLKDICDVVDPALLDLKLLDCLIKI
jgi:hypothetical protein